VGFSETSIWIPFFITSIVSTMSNSQLFASNSNGTFGFTEPEQLHQLLKFSEKEKVQLTHALQLVLEENGLKKPSV
jgi:hypothetical protein